jgi:hypothetical protein
VFARFALWPIAAPNLPNLAARLVADLLPGTRHCRPPVFEHVVGFQKLLFDITQTHRPLLTRELVFLDPESCPPIEHQLRRFKTSP